MKVEIAAIKAKIVAMFATLAKTGASLTGAYIRPPTQPYEIQKVVVEQALCKLDPAKP